MDRAAGPGRPPQMTNVNLDQVLEEHSDSTYRWPLRTLRGSLRHIHASTPEQNGNISYTTLKRH
eukprot:8838010-Prorocentrum_lima.AAC.1